jgi:hypothetical protein
VTQVLASDPVAIPLLRRLPAVMIQDSSIVLLPAPLATTWRGYGSANPLTYTGSTVSVPHSSDFVARLLRAKASPPRLLNDRERPEDHRACQRYCQRRIAGRVCFD